MHRAFPILALVVVAAVAAATVPALGLLTAAAAVAWGRGFAAGGLAALLATLLALRSTPSDRLSAVVAVAAMQFAGLAAVAAAVHWSGTAILDGLAGIAAGWLVTSLILHRGAQSVGAQSVAASGVGFVTALCAAAALGHFRQAAAAVTPPWIEAALVLGALVALTLLAIGIAAASSERRRPEPPRVTRDVLLVVLACLIVAGAAYAVATRTLHEPRFLAAAGIGLALPLVLAWLLVADERPETPGALSLETAIGVLVALGAGIAAFYALAGYGIGVMLVAASLPAGLLLALGIPRDANGHAPGDRVVQLLLFGAVVVVYRVFVQRFQDDLGAAALTDHLAIFSIVVGAVLPSLLGGILGRTGSNGEAVLRLVLTLTGAAAAGAALLVLWGARAGLGLLAGLMLGAAMHGGGSRVGLLALAAALPLIQWSHALLVLSAQTRAEKARVLVWLVGVAVAVIAAADLWGRLTRRARPDAGGAL